MATWGSRDYQPHPLVVDLHDEPYNPSTMVYVGRSSRWANPFIEGMDGTGKEVIAKYRTWLLTKPRLVADLPSLRGKLLACWCASPCHAEVLAELANSENWKQALGVKGMR
jgi:hypothetical protein